MISSSDKITYKLLSGAGVLPSEALEQAFKSAESGQAPFWKALVKSSGMGEYELYEILAKQTGIPVVSLRKITVEPGAIERVPVKVAWHYKFFPYKMDDGKVWVAFAQVPDVSVLDEIRFVAGVEALVSFASEKDIEEMLNKHYGLGAEMVNKILSQNPSAHHGHAPASTHHVEDIENLAETASVAQLVNQIILEAYKKRASDIHLEPFRGKIRLRYRIDGVLQEAPVPAEMRKFFGPILSRIKILSNLNVVERRLPQDGKMRVKTQEQTFDLRVSSVPTSHGESMVIRILPGNNVRRLDTLGLDPAHLSTLRSLLERPSGIIFVTGPTGSGKSSTLYAALSEMNSEQRKIITIEDPVEYELEGVSQIQVAADIGLGFSQGLRSVLRQDPDVLMVGEVRDLETADIAIRAALTGHLILSTMHTNDAASGVTRLTDIGVEKYLVASSVIAFIAQRLVRVICRHCKTENKELDVKAVKQIMASLGVRNPESLITYRGQGCEHCNHTGYAGRQAIYEMLTVTEDIRRLIMDGSPAGVIKRRAMAQGMQTLRQAGFSKVLEGVTTVEEILKMTPPDQDRPESPFIEADSKAAAIYVPVKLPDETEKSGKGDKKDASQPAIPDDNRRKFKRVPVQMKITYRILEFNPQHPQHGVIHNLNEKDWDGEIENISAGGMLFSSENMSLAPGGHPENPNLTVEEALSTGNILELQIHLSDGESPVSCISRILRVSRTVKKIESVEKFVFHIAVLFLVIDSADRLRIEKFCESAAAGSAS